MAKKEKRAGIDLTGNSIDAIIEKLNTRYGANTLVLATKALGLRIEFISTGVYKLDAAMGGGIPKNRITELRGPFSSLKTTIIHTTEANFQQTHKKGMVFHIDVEKTLDVDYAKKLGCDLKRFVIVNPDSGEQAIDVLNDVLGTGVDVLVAIDSIAALVPTAEIEGSTDDQYMGLHPRLIARMMRVCTAKMKRTLYTRNTASTTVLCANQLREKIGVMFGNPETTPGGRAKDFFYSMMVRLSSTPSDKLMNKIKIGNVERNIQYGQNVKYNVSKNKCGGNQHEEGEFEYYKKRFKHYPAFSFNNDDFLFEYGIFFGIVKEKNGKYVYAPSSGLITGGKDHIFIENLAQDEDARQELFEEIMEKVIIENSGEENADIEFTESDEVEVVPKKKKKMFFKKK
jgi:recombination protein RecA